MGEAMLLFLGLGIVTAIPGGVCLALTGVASIDRSDADRLAAFVGGLALSSAALGVAMLFGRAYCQVVFA